MTDNSPQLGGQDHDNAPMISGRGTKIIVSARGAYEARNLPALFDAMDAEQQLAYRQTVIRMVLNHIRSEIEQSVAQHPLGRSLLADLDRWLVAPTELIHTSHDQGIDWRLRSLVRVAMQGGVLSIRGAAQVAEGSSLYPQLIDLVRYSEVEDWIFEVGWAVIHGGPSPTLDLDAARLSSLSVDVDRWYRKRNLAILVRMMNADQEAQFKQAVGQQAILYIDRVPISEWPPDAHGYIEQVRGWLADPATLTEAYVSAAAAAHHRSLMSSFTVLLSLVRAFGDHHRHQNARRDVSYAEAVLDMAYLAHGKFAGTREVALKDEIMKAARRWQLNAAYAILTDQPMPPLE